MKISQTKLNEESTDLGGDAGAGSGGAVATEQAPAAPNSPPAATSRSLFEDASTDQASSGAPGAEGEAGAPAQAQEPAGGTAQGWIGEDGNFVEGWQKRLLPPELQDDATLALFKSPEEWARSTIQTKAMVGKKFSAPSENSTPEEVARFREAVGVPPTPEGYGDLKPETMPDELWSEEVGNNFANLAHEANLSKAQVAAVLNFYGEQVGADLQMSEAELDRQQAEGRARLKSTFGADYSAKMSAAAAAMAEAKIPADHWATESPEMIEAFANLASAYGREGTMVKGAAAQRPSLDAQIAEFNNPNTTNPVARQYQKLDPGTTPANQASAQQERLRLIALRDKQ